MSEPTRSAPTPARLSSRSDRVFEVLILLLASIIVLVFLTSIYQLGKDSWPALQHFGLSFFTQRTWNPVAGTFGAASMIAGTLVTSLAALVISVPLAVASALFVAEYAPKWLANPVGYLIELLAAVPSVVYGLWALFVIAPILGRWQITFFNPEFPDRLALYTKCAGLWAENKTTLQCFFVPSSGAGRGLALAIIILTVMILPYTASVARDVIRLVPADQREAMYALGATKWEVISRAILPYARAGILGGVILALGRALGETLAVAMVIGDSQDVLRSIWGNASTMASVIANQFGDARETLHRSSVVTLGLTLFFLSVAVNYVARLIIARLTPRGIQ
ncbi:phosphate ABC transporter permease subunit PstC [Deinococcus sp. KSM4-11]|uniref:phosphate ABC transporter permease subunit PstC n=1 Tax=Deinococcus sp. KSM4-11 TaxID=2568654 RepID=UPI0010A3F4F6|nr:phosphate ABC transporter permease subunit PstC [Deinococcus sp. KSM4-11]THF86264.1 phosphate ABC transporter permease subunit PstC [Deinococcus sp. KSM4-11]